MNKKHTPTLCQGIASTGPEQQPGTVARRDYGIKKAKSLLGLALMAGTMLFGGRAKAQSVISPYSILSHSIPISGVEMAVDNVNGYVYIDGQNFGMDVVRLTSGGATVVTTNGVGSTGYDMPYARTGYNFADGNIYSYLEGSGTMGLLRTNPSTGVSTVVTTNSENGAEECVGVANHILYYSDGSGGNNQLHSYNLLTSTATDIGSHTVPGSGFAEAYKYCVGNSTMYFVNSNGSSGTLYTVNLTTGAFTPVVGIPDAGYSHFDVDPYGNYVYYNSSTSGGTIKRINLSTLATETFATGLSNSFFYDVVIGTSLSGTATSVYMGGNSLVYEVQIGPLVSAGPPAAITGTANICVGATATLSDATTGGTWSTSSTDVATVDAGGVVTGVLGGTVLISYTTSGGTVTTTATVNAAPAGFTVSGGGSYCSGGSGVSVGLAGSETGVNYQLYNGMSAVGTPVAGTGSGFDFGLMTANGSYSVMGTNTTSGCMAAMNSAVSVTRNLLPTAFTVSGGGSYCAGGSGVSVGLSGSESGVDYLLYNGMSPVGMQEGTGDALNFGMETSMGTYTVGATNASTGCTSTMTGSSSVSVNALPTAYTVSGGGAYCTGGSGVAVGLANSQEGVNYQLLYGAGPSPVGSAVAGTGSALNFGMQTMGGSYTVVGINGSTGCGSIMSGSATVMVNTTPTVGVSSDITICAGSSTPLTATGAATYSWSGAGLSATTGASVTATPTTSTMYMVTGTSAAGCTNAASVTVSINSAVLGPISAPATMCVGTTITMTNETGGGTWSSGIVGLATVGSSTGAVTGVGAGNVAITYSLGCNRAIDTITVLASPNGITGTYTACEGATATLGNTVSGGTWTSVAGSGTASVGASTGVVTAGTAGTVTISYTLADMCARTATFTVSSAPTSILGTLGVCVGTSSSLTDATGTGTWSSSASTTASINGTTGVVTGMGVGTATVTYSLGAGCKTTATVSVNAPPATITGTKKACPMTTTTLADGTGGGVWTSGTPGLATVGSSTGIVTGQADGVATISYTAGGCSTTTQVTINPNPSAIAGTTTICIGTTTSLSDPTPSGSTWSSSTTSVATISNATAVASGLTAGTTTISYIMATGCYATTTLTVTSAPAAITGTLSVVQGSTTTLDNATSGGTWSTTATTAGIVAGTGNTGVLTGLNPGTATITYSTGVGCTKTATATVTGFPGIVNGYKIVCIGLATTMSCLPNGGTWSIAAGTGTATISAIGRVVGGTSGTVTVSYTLPGGGVSTGTVTVQPIPSVSTGITTICAGETTLLSNTTAEGSWSSNNGAIATVGTDGTVTGTATGGTGIANISYTFGAATSGCYSITKVTVNNLPKTITGTLSFCQGSTSVLASLSAGGTWTSASPAIATIGTAHTAAGLLPGTAEISYTLPTTCFITTTVTVLPAPVAGTITGGSAIHIAVTPNLALSDATGDAGGIWSSSNTAKGTVDASSGVVTGIAAGSTTISYTVTLGTCTTRATQLVTITALRGVNGGSATGEITEISLYPNPSRGTIMLNTPGNGEFTVFAIDGKEVKRYTITEKASTLELPNGLAAGVYMCRYIGENGDNAVVRLVYQP